MKTSPQRLIFCLMLLFPCLQETVSAGLVLDFSADNGANFGNRFEVQTGENLTIGVFLQQTAPDTVLNDEGIVSWGLELTRDPTDLGTLSAPSVNPLFDFENGNASTASGFVLEYAQAAGSGVTGDSILLASFEFNATATGETEFTISDRFVGSGPGNASWFTPTFSELDEQIFGVGAADSYQFSISAVSAVPEPSSLALLGGFAALSVLRRPRRTIRLPEG